MMMFDEAEQIFIDFMHSILLCCFSSLAYGFIFCFVSSLRALLFFGRNINKTAIKWVLKAFNNVSRTEIKRTFNSTFSFHSLTLSHSFHQINSISRIELNFIEHAIVPLIRVQNFNVKLIKNKTFWNYFIFTTPALKQR